MAEWKPLDWAECGHCGDAVEVCTDLGHDGYVYDGESVRCVTCRYLGSTVVEEDGSAWVNWDNPGEFAPRELSEFEKQMYRNSGVYAGSVPQPARVKKHQ